jgi:hypothetical protein
VEIILENVGGIDSLSRNSKSDMRKDKDWTLRSWETVDNEINGSFAFCKAWGDLGWSSSGNSWHIEPVLNVG